MNPGSLVTIKKSLFDSLPNELLAEIFIHSKLHPAQTYHETTLLNLLRVCWRWRLVSQNTARLWTNLDFVFFDGPLKHLRSMVSTWIRLSYPLPISITATVEYNKPKYYLLGEEGQRTVFDAVIGALCDVSPRWQEIEVELPLQYATRIIDAALEGPTSCTRLDVTVMDGLQGKSRLRLPDIRHIYLNAVTTVLQGDTNLSSIRYLNLDSLTDVDSCIGLIESSPNLEKLRVTFAGAKMEYGGDPVLAPNLVSMNLVFSPGCQFEGSGVLSTIFHKVTAPSLTTLCLTEPGEACLQLLSVQDFFARSKCPLRRFFYDGQTSNGQLGTILNICKLTSSLETVDLPAIVNFEDFTRSLVGLGDTQLLPKLINLALEMTIYFFDDRIKQPLREFAERRCRKNGGGCLEKVTLFTSCIGLCPIEDVEFVEELRSLGVEFSLRLTDYWVTRSFSPEWD